MRRKPKGTHVYNSLILTAFNISERNYPAVRSAPAEIPPHLHLVEPSVCVGRESAAPSASGGLLLRERAAGRTGVGVDYGTRGTRQDSLPSSRDVAASDNVQSHYRQVALVDRRPSMPEQRGIPPARQLAAPGGVR